MAEGGREMNNTINISTNKQICAKCGKRGKGFYEATNAPGKYICCECILKNIKRKD
jgi:late competence protein required for DNA uptake (superfamily II DNA/RNA helicase)